MSREDKRERDEELESLRQEVAQLRLKADKLLHPVLAYVLRTIGSASLLFGGAGLMVGTSFSWSATFLSLGLVLLIIDPWLEPSLRSHSAIWRLMFSIFFAAFLASFFAFIVFLPSPLDVRARDYNGNYTPGTKIGTIEWKPEYSDLRIVFENPTDEEYKKLDFVIKPGMFIVDQSQTTTLEGVQVFNTAKGPDIATVTSTNKAGEKGYLPPSQTTFFSNNIRVLCDTLPKHTDFEIVLAVATPPRSQDLKAGLLLNPQRTPATLVHIEGTYESKANRPHAVNKDYNVALN